MAAGWCARLEEARPRAVKVDRLQTDGSPGGQSSLNKSGFDRQSRSRNRPRAGVLLSLPASLGSCRDWGVQGQRERLDGIRPGGCGWLQVFFFFPAICTHEVSAARCQDDGFWRVRDDALVATEQVPCSISASIDRWSLGQPGKNRRPLSNLQQTDCEVHCSVHSPSSLSVCVTISMPN